ncbi:unnamed protein product [Spirodela intermedia]|uniref:Uncharacterized protein n=2 Tax=Spirodela intermedia TaxID=51605 RepID=A0A7I8J751_SPIIN|nr:unnamed protein product [Spirodela intermedia]CAA6666047.1 unnamed protein product [Spirodela intermedia]CAA7402811.1 unnamed protein product [Spirodela intermedia]
MSISKSMQKSMRTCESWYEHVASNDRALTDKWCG